LSLSRYGPGAKQFTGSTTKDTTAETELAIGSGKVIDVNPQKSPWIARRRGRAGLAQVTQSPAPSPLLLDPTSRPVYAGDVGPGTWVVELPGRVVPVTVPPGAVAVPAGFLSPHAYVAPVRMNGVVMSESLLSIA